MQAIVLAAAVMGMLVVGVAGRDRGRGEFLPVRPATAASSSNPCGATTGGSARITFTGADHRLYRVEPRSGAVPEDISQALDRLSSGEDEWLNLARDAGCLLLSTSRFAAECRDEACLVVAAADLSRVEVVRSAGAVVHPQGFSAVGVGGELIVSVGSGGPHQLDLWALARLDEGWSAPRLLTSGSPYGWNAQPALAPDGATVLFDCGDEPYAAAGTAICEVGSEGRGLRVVLTPNQAPAGLPAGGALRHAGYAPDGSIVFEGDWGDQQLWRLPRGGGEPVRPAAGLSNDNTPCVLPDGRIVSLWYPPDVPGDRPRLKVMAADGTVLIADLLGDPYDVADIGCGGA